MIDRPDALSPATLLAHGGMAEPDATGALLPAPQFATTFLREADNSYRDGRVYARDDNPTFEAPERLLCKLEGGHEARLFSSGMAAATTLFQALRPGDHVVAPKVMYWALRNWLKGPAADRGLRVDFADLAKADELRKALIPGRTKLLWVETPANPTWAITDLALAAEAAHAAGALLAVDSSASTPLITRPIEFGADFVMHACTKYLNGHDNVVAGMLIAAQPSDLWERAKALRRSNGSIPGTFDSWLLLNGMRTLAVRVERACSSAAMITSALSSHPRIERVLYPGLATHPGHDVAKRQMAMFGGMFSLVVAGGAKAAIQAAAKMKIWRRATSFGGPESLVEHRRSIEGADSPAPPGLLRMSTGLEDPADLLADLKQALA
ncbi:MAG TPA: PLP-dependent aspartate aminotransferase family protein [Sphingomicrobium sp.]|nr:PLP-dependent aspartate aminotransferase family protein [Sphingomicrobium sp.]